MSNLTTVSVRAFDKKTDLNAIKELDSSYTSLGCFKIHCDADSLIIRPHKSPLPQQRSFPIDLELPHWSNGWIAENDEAGVIGFIATDFESWNRRLKIWHFYVNTCARGRGVGRRLMESALLVGRNQGATTAWAETSNWNLPGIEVYRHLGFQLCGFDETLYHGTLSKDEFAVFLAKRL